MYMMSVACECKNNSYCTGEWRCDDCNTCMMYKGYNATDKVCGLCRPNIKIDIEECKNMLQTLYPKIEFLKDECLKLHSDNMKLRTYLTFMNDEYTKLLKASLCS